MLSSHVKLHPRFLAKPIAPFRARVYTSLSRTPASEWKLLLGPEFYSPGTNINPAWLHGFPQLLHSNLPCQLPVSLQPFLCNTFLWDVTRP